MYFDAPTTKDSMMDGMKPPLVLRVLLDRLERLDLLVTLLTLLAPLLPPIFGRTSNPLTPRTSLPAEADD